MIYVVIAVVVVTAIAGGIFIFRNNNKDKNKTKEIDGPINLAVVEKFMCRKEVEFYYFLNSILPKDKIAFPKVGVDNLLFPTTNKVAYNNLMSKYVDFVVFDEQTMKPLLVIDVYDDSYNDEILDEQEPFVKKVLKEVKLPIISIKIKGKYDAEEVKNKILEIINPNKNIEEK